MAPRLLPGGGVSHLPGVGLNMALNYIFIGPTPTLVRVFGPFLVLGELGLD